MELIKKWKNDRLFTFRFISNLLGVSVAHIQSVYYGRGGVSIEVQNRAQTIERLIDLIEKAPNDILLLKYELSEFTGLSIEEIENGEKKAEEKIAREVRKRLPNEPSNLRLVTLVRLKKIRENGYKGALKKNGFYDANAVDAEIARKTFNMKRKKEIYLEKMALRV